MIENIPFMLKLTTGEASFRNSLGFQEKCSK
jgi:hypothetical protein